MYKQVHSISYSPVIESVLEKTFIVIETSLKCNHCPGALKCNELDSLMVKMEPIVDDPLPSEDLQLFFLEVTDSQQEPDEEDHLLDEVEQATDFLHNAGLSDLSQIYQQGIEICDTIVNDSVRRSHLTEKQAQTVRSRVRTLNKTLRNRQPRRKQRQDIRDVAWKNVESSSSGSRSRSATPDSLDFEEPSGEFSSDDDAHLPPIANLGAIPKQKIKIKSNNHRQKKVFHQHDRGTVAHSDSNKVVLKAYYPKNEFNETNKLQREHRINNNTIGVQFKQTQNDSEGYLSSSPNSATTPSPTNVLVDESAATLSFESLKKKLDDEFCESSYTMSNVMSIDDITDSEYQYLKPLLWVEMTSIFDQYNIFILKRKPASHKKRGNVFNANLSSLVMRDMRDMHDMPNPSDNTMVPQIYQTVLLHLTTRCVREDGIMRVACQKQRLESICNDIETKFYNNRLYIENLLTHMNVHELTGVLKKLIRDLPDPILTMELFDMFYKTNMVPVRSEKIRVLNLLVLLLPIEHRNTLRELIRFFLRIIDNEKYNRMSLPNVAVIVAPTLFTLRLLNPGRRFSIDKPLTHEELAKQITTAANCCNIVELFLRAGENLWMVPTELVVQAREAQKKAQDRKEFGMKEKKTHAVKKKLHRSSTQYEPGAMLSPKITRDYML